MRLEPHVALHEGEEAFISVVTASELLHGVHRATQADIRAKRSAFVEGILEHFPLLEIYSTCARAHARVWGDLRQAGTFDIGLGTEGEHVLRFRAVDRANNEGAWTTRILNPE